MLIYEGIETEVQYTCGQARDLNIFRSPILGFLQL